MRFTKHSLVSTSLLAAALVTNAAPIDSNNPTGHLPDIASLASRPSFTILSIPLINHNNGQFWSASVQVEGSPSAGIDTALDTGGGQFILPSADAPPCQAGNCQRGTLSPSELQNLQNLNFPFSESFGSGTISGDLFTDTVSIGGVNLGQFIFELATNGTGTALSAGTIGLGLVNNFTPELASLGIIDTQSFSLLLSETGGEMLLGGINPGNFVGQLQYVNGATAGDGFWRIDIVEFGFSGPTNPSLKNTQFIFDTGTPVTSLPADTIQSIANDFQGTVTNGLAVVPCANIQGQTFSITFSEGVTFTFPIPTLTSQTSDGQCQIQFTSTTGTPFIGANLLTLFYTFFQVESNTMGFARAAESPVSTQAVQVTDPNNLPQVTGAASS